MNLFSTFLAETTTNANATGADLATQSLGSSAGGLLQILFLIVPLGLMYLILIVPQRRKEKKQKELIGGAIVGDTIVTIGGFVGKIVNIKDDEVTFETGVERTKVMIKKWAIKEVVKAISN